MPSYKEVDYKVRKTWWPLWLIPLLIVILVILIAIFIFVYTLDSKHHCLFGCEQPRDHIAIADPVPRNDEVFIPKPNNTNKHMMEITGKLKFEGAAPNSIPPDSYLRVKFEDTSLMDAPSVLLGETSVDVSNYKKGEDLTYAIKCKKPKHPMSYGHSVSAVLNMGWKPTGNAWIRKGDYFTDTSHNVKLEDGKNEYKEFDITLVLY